MAQLWDPACGRIIGMGQLVELEIDENHVTVDGTLPMRQPIAAWWSSQLAIKLTVDHGQLGGQMQPTAHPGTQAARLPVGCILIPVFQWWPYLTHSDSTGSCLDYFLPVRPGERTWKRAGVKKVCPKRVPKHRQFCSSKHLDETWLLLRSHYSLKDSQRFDVRLTG
jgi:hypothetical protein